MIAACDVLGAVLAGGRSTRMGRDKSLLPLGGQSLIEHAVQLMQQHFERVVIVSDFPERYAFLRLQIIPDQFRGIGPLGGIHAALVNSDTDMVFVSSCDTPLVPSRLIGHLLEIDSPRRARIPRLHGELQPLFGLYERSLLVPMRSSISRGDFSVQNFLKTIDYLPVDITLEHSFYSPEMFANLNNPLEYHKISQRFDVRSERSAVLTEQ